MEIYNNVVEQIIKKINKKYGRINSTIDDQSLLKEMNENDNRFIGILTEMISLQEKMTHEGRRKYKMIYSHYTRMVDRNASSMTKKSGSFTLNFCLRRSMCQSVIIVKKLIASLDEMIKKEESSTTKRF